MPHDHPRLELLKQKALEMGLSRDQVREFGSLTRRATWESAIAFRQATNGEFDRWKELENVDNVIHKPSHVSISSILNLPQLFLLFLLTVGFFVLVLPALREIADFFPIKITIQIGGK